MITEARTSEIVREFQLFCKNKECDITQFTLEELEAAHRRLGGNDNNEPYRKAMLNRIAELKRLGDRKYDSRVRRRGYLVALAIGLISGVVSTLAALYVTGNWAGF